MNAVVDVLGGPPQRFCLVDARHDMGVHRDLEKTVFLKLARVFGAGPGDMREVRVLSRAIRRISNWICCEADPRHCELVVEQFGVDKLKGLSTPGLGWKDDDLDPTTDAELSDSRGILSQAFSC